MFFELEDIQRRHSPYSDLTNTTGWHTAVDSTPSWNYQRGFLIGVVSGLCQQYFSLFHNNFRSLLQHYEPPASLSQWSIFIRQTRKLQNFKLGFKNRMQYGLAYGALGIAPMIAFFRQFNSGWQTNFAGFDYAFHRKIPTTLLAAVLSSPFAVAMQMAQKAYYADKTFPPQLQKKYKSFFNCLTRIPFEEGPYYLFKNTMPLFYKHILGYFTLFYTHDWLIDKMSILSRASNVPSGVISTFSALVSIYLTAIFVYPMSNTAVEMVDMWPKKNGVCPYDGSYRNAYRWMFYSQWWNTAWPGLFKNFFWHHAPSWFITLLLAQKLGIFSYWRVDIMSGPGDNTNDDSFI